jgi:hypothetical protein
MLEREWEKFRGGPAGKSAEEVRVSIYGRGHLYLNAKAYQVLGRPKAVAIYYNREQDAIALEPANPRSVESFQITRQSTGWLIRATSFCRHYKIRIETTERFLRPDLTNEGQLILNLRETVNVGGIKKNRIGRSQ